MKDKAFFTSGEAAAFEKQLIERNNADRRDGGPEADVGRAYNDAWYDRGPGWSKHCALLLSWIRPRSSARDAARCSEAPAERLAQNRGCLFDGPENRSLAERCLIWPTLGPPMLPSFCNNTINSSKGPDTSPSFLK
jgi:hypothetical protein